MKESSLEHEINAIEVRKAEAYKGYAKSIAIAIICFSLLTFAFTAAYIGTFLLFQ